MPHEEKAITTRQEFRIHGMDCAEEVSLLRRRLSGMDGIFDLQFDIFRGKMTVEFEPAMADAGQIQAAVAQIGMRCEPWSEAESNAPASLGRLAPAHAVLASSLLLLAGILFEGWHSGNLWVALLAHGHEAGASGAEGISLACFLLAIAAGMYAALPKAMRSLGALRPDMNALVLVSMIGAGFLGQWIEAATLSFLFGLSGLLETWSVARARRAITSLMDLLPAEARQVRGGAEELLPVEHIAIGSIIRVKPGERIPCDAEVLSGGSYVNQALITGESVPVWKAPGSRVYAGAMNGDGALEMCTVQLASDTVLSRVLRMVESSGRRRATSERFVDRFARYYTPAMFAVAAAVALVPPLLFGGSWSRWFYESMLVLLISCPCALVISTPVSFVSALTAAARRGVLIKGGSFLEEAAVLKVMALDKTGVLTCGTPAVRSLQLFSDSSREQALSLLAGVEEKSGHPVARAILQYAADLRVVPAQCSEFRALQGRGVEAIVDGRRIWIGGRRMLEEQGASGETALAELMREQDQRHSVVAFGSGNRVGGLVILEDAVREEAPAVLQAARRLGIRRLVMLTGDNQGTARQVADFLGLDEVHASALPEQKVAVIQALRKKYGGVAMVGDGISDATAMAAANIGIALGHRSAHLATESADVVVLSGELEQLTFLMAHARRTLRVVRQNVIFALALKAAFLAMTALSIATLWMAIAADTGATLLVTLNGLRLLRTPRLKPQ